MYVRRLKYMGVSIIMTYKVTLFLCSARAMSDDLKVIKDHEVREWLETTFTKRESVYNRPPITGNKKFKRAATLVMYGKYLNK